MPSALGAQLTTLRTGRSHGGLGQAARSPVHCWVWSTSTGCSARQDRSTSDCCSTDFGSGAFVLIHPIPTPTAVSGAVP